LDESSKVEEEVEDRHEEAEFDAVDHELDEINGQPMSVDMEFEEGESELDQDLPSITEDEDDSEFEEDGSGYSSSTSGIPSPGELSLPLLVLG
jgi:hypothetical protein